MVVVAGMIWGDDGCNFPVMVVTTPDFRVMFMS